MLEKMAIPKFNFRGLKEGTSYIIKKERTGYKDFYIVNEDGKKITIDKNDSFHFEYTK